MIDGVAYVFEARPLITSGQCAMLPLTNSPNNMWTQSLLNTGQLLAPGNVGIGSCRQTDVRIVDTASGEIISYANATVDNT